MNFKLFLSIILIQFNIINAKIKDDQILENTCLGRYTGVFHSFIYYSNNQTSDQYYVIRTAWLLTYPDRIKNELKNKNFYVYDKNPSTKCNWVLRSRITNVGIYTGFIYQKNEENKLLQEEGQNILTDIYPSVEIALTVIGSFIAVCILIWIKTIIS